MGKELHQGNGGHPTGGPLGSPTKNGTQGKRDARAVKGTLLIKKSTGHATGVETGSTDSDAIQERGVLCK